MITKRRFSWFAEQVWKDIVFVHWPVSKEWIQPYVPHPFMIDTYEGNAWLSVVSFQAEWSKLRWMPDALSFSSVTQVNVRTYVKSPSSPERGVYFFSLHVNSMLAVLGARTLFQLPFHYIPCAGHKKTIKDRLFICDQKQTAYCINYKQRPEKVHNGLSTFLTERYCIWHLKGNAIIKIPIHHSRWSLFHVDVEVEQNTLLSHFEQPFIAYYSPFKKARLYPYEVVGWRFSM